jgi:hypothetical protein
LISPSGALQHFMAHGFMRAELDRAGNHRFELLRYTREGEGKYQLIRSTTDIPRLRNAVEDIGSYVNELIRAHLPREETRANAYRSTAIAAAILVHWPRLFDRFRLTPAGRRS